jgi:hypothetical protein
MQIVEPVAKTFKIARTIVVTVHESLQIQTVNDGILIPKFFEHIPQVDNALPDKKAMPTGGRPD